MNQMVISEEQLEKQSREELVVLVKVLLAEIEQLKERVAELEAKSPSGKPPATSRDQKTNLGEKKSQKRVGAKPGHKLATRPLVEKPDRVIEAKAERRANCHADLHAVVPGRIIGHQIEELPMTRTIVIETQIHEVECPRCHTFQRGAPPEGLGPTRQFGPRLEATVIYYRQEQHLSYERIVETMRDLSGVELSEGGINAILRRGARLAQPQADKIADTVAQSEIIGSDETSAIVKGHNWWQWVFRSVAGVVHLIVPTREAEVIRQFMGANCAERWVSDCYSSQLLAPAKNRHLCLSHQIRDLERVIEQDPQLPWPVEMQDLFREGIHLWNRFTIEGEMTVDGNLRRVTELENRLDDLMAEDQTGTAARKLYKRYVKHRSHLLYFLQQPGVPTTNNACESALRPSVIHRKVTDGFRSEWAAKGGGHPNLS